MRRVILGLLLVACSHGPPPHTVTVEPPDETIAYFDLLAPYGKWVKTTEGVAWRPHEAVVGADFVPYATNGQWLRTVTGWVFASDFAWGAVTFHYGRWYRAPGYGWVWQPGGTWSPAWVAWRGGGGWIGWAPQPPADLASRDPVESHPELWVFVDAAHMTAPDVGRWAAPAGNVRALFAATRPGQPTQRDVARWSTHRQLQ
jgi:hypothetical protein